MPKLTDKQRRFIEAYLECWNATEAAKKAGYQGSYDSLRVIGSQNLTKPKIRKKIEERIAGEAMSANEVLWRLSEQARADISEFIQDYGAIDWDAVQEKGYLIKRIRHKKGEYSQIDLHDSQSALEKLGKALGLFTDKLDLTSGGEQIRVLVGGLKADDV